MFKNVSPNESLFYHNFPTPNVLLSWHFVALLFHDLFDQEMGVPQGAILSVAVFILKIYSIIKCLLVGVRGSLYVDDFCICFRLISIIAIERQIQQCINSIQNWADKNGFQFSKS